MSEKVVHISGGTIPEIEVDPAIVEMAEKFLARCKAGEVKSACIIWVRGCGHPSHAAEYRPESVSALHSGMVCAAHWMTELLNEESAPPAYDPLESA